MAKPLNETGDNMATIPPQDAAAIEEFARGVIDFDGLTMRIPSVEAIGRARHGLMAELEAKKALTTAERYKLSRLQTMKAQLNVLNQAQSGRNLTQVRDLLNQNAALINQIEVLKVMGREMILALQSHPGSGIQHKLAEWRKHFDGEDA